MSSPYPHLPLILHSISPTLSAFHVGKMRGRLRSGGEEEEKEGERPIDELAETHCARCRRFQLDGSADTRLVRDNKLRSSSVILRKSCRSCGFTRQVPLVKRGAAIFQNQRRRNRQNPNLKHSGTQSEMEEQARPAARAQTPPIRPATPQARESATSDVPKKSKNRKARSGLKEMLERKRKQDEAQSTGTSLASFLEEL